jgi:enamine deaminase RidA (YjgF/YER057c/UK114 family)
MEIEAKLESMGLVLPPPVKLAPGIVLPFSFVRVVGNRALISGHGAQNADGTSAEPFGKLGADVTIEQGYAAARNVALSMIGSLKRELGDLDRIDSWVRLFGMVNCTPDFAQQPAVINGCSDLIIEIWGPERGAHTRSAVGMSSLPFDMAVEIEGEVLLRD